MVIYIAEDEELFVTRTFYNKETGSPTRQETRNKEGMLHAPPDGTPSIVRFDEQGRPTDLIWHAHNLEHREGAPSAIVLYSETGTPMTEQFCVNGQPIPAEIGAFRVFYSKDGNVIRSVLATAEDLVPDDTIKWQQNQLEP